MGHKYVEELLDRFLQGMRQLEERRAQHEEAWRVEVRSMTAAFSAKMQALIQVFTGNGVPTAAARVSVATSTGAVARLTTSALRRFFLEHT